MTGAREGGTEERVGCERGNHDSFCPQFPVFPPVGSDRLPVPKTNTFSL